MNITEKILTAIVFAASVSTFAFADSPSTADKPAVSGKTREEVIAEMEPAGGNLGRRNYEATFNPVPAKVSQKTRAQVVSELIESGGDDARNNSLTTTSR